MNEHVPEMDARLQQWLALEKFHKYRGKLGELEAFLKMVLTDEKSSFFSNTVSNFKRNCGGVLGPDLMVLGVKIVQLMRNQQQDFADEVLRALFRENYLLPGEISLEKLVPYTVVMLEPTRTAAVIKWVVNSIYCEELIYHFQPEKRCHDRPLCPENAEIHAALPSLWRFVQLAEKERLLNHNNDFVRMAYAEDILSKHIAAIVALYKKGGIGLHLNHGSQNVDWQDSFSSDNGGVNMGLGCRDIPRDLLHFSQYLAFIIKAEQGDVLSLFPRNSDIATWQLKLPESMTNQGRGFSIGIHAEIANEKWQKKLPMFASKGEAHAGLKAIAIPHMYEELLQAYGAHTREHGLSAAKHGQFQTLFDFSVREFKEK